MRTVSEERRDTPLIGEYEVIVLGGGPAGIAAAGRTGRSTILVERYGFLGGEYLLSEDDVLDCADFRDAIGVNGWPVEEHVSGDVEFRFARRPRGFNQLPYRMVVPLGVDNLLVAGRCASMTHGGRSAAPGIRPLLRDGPGSGHCRRPCLEGAGASQVCGSLFVAEKTGARGRLPGQGLNRLLAGGDAAQVRIPHPGEDIARLGVQPGQGFLEALHCPAQSSYQEVDPLPAAFHRDRLVVELARGMAVLGLRALENFAEEHAVVRLVGLDVAQQLPLLAVARPVVHEDDERFRPRALGLEHAVQESVQLEVSEA
jgi:FAD dependent oxidoreductase